MNLEDARARLALQSARWSEQLAQAPVSWPTPTRSEIQTKADTGDLVMYKDWDGSPIAADAIDPVFDPNVLPPPPPEIPVIFGTPQVGCELHALPGAIVPKRYFRWQRDGVEIPNAVNLRYTLTSADVGHKIAFAATRARQVARSREVGPIVGHAKR